MDVIYIVYGDLMDFERVDMDNLSEEELQEAFKMNEILFRLNHTMPMTPEYGEVLRSFLVITLVKTQWFRRLCPVRPWID